MADWERSTGFEEWPGCLGCAHLRRRGGAHCAAYPDGIPFVISCGQFDHLVPRPGQMGDTLFTHLDIEVFKATGERVPAPSQEPAQIGRIVVGANWERAPNSDDYVGCLACVHRRRGTHLCCAAYPDVIPFAIVSGQVDHLVPRPGQVGDTVFEEFDFQVWRETGQRVPLRKPEPATPGS